MVLEDRIKNYRNGVRNMDYLFYVVQLLICVLETCLFYAWGRAFVGEKERNKVVLGICIATASIIRFALELLPNALYYSSFLILLLFVILGALLLQRKRIILLFYTFVYCTIGLAVSFLFNRVFHFPITILIQGIICLFLMKKCKPERKAYCIEKYTIMTVLPGCIFVYAACTYGFITITDGFSVENALLVGGNIVVILVEMVMLYLVREFSESMWKSEEVRLCMERDKMEKRHYQNMEEQHEQYDAVIHDIKHVIRAMAAMSQMKDENSEDIIRLMERINLSIGKISDKEYCGNKTLNALLLERIAFAEEQGVVLELEVIEPLQLSKFDELDLISLMGNLLDNAILAEGKVENPQKVYCRIALSRDFEHLIIQVENSYEEKAITTRNRPEGKIGSKHGIGLDSIAEIVSKYGGIMDTFKEDGRYRTKIIFPV